MRARRPLFTVVLALVLSFAAASADAQTKRPIGYDAYNSWRAIEDTTLSDDGAWLAYALVEQEGDGELVVRNLRSGSEFRHARGKDPVITADGRFVVFTVVPALADVKKAEKEKKKADEKPKNGLGIMTLADGRVTTIEGVKSFKVPELGASRIAYLKEKRQKAEGTSPASQKAEEGSKKARKKDPGTDLVIRDLATGTEATVAEVVEYVWNKDGSWLAYGVSSAQAANDGAFARNAQDGSTVALLKGRGHYKGFAFDEAGKQLAFVSDQAEYAQDASPYRLYLWAAGAQAAAELVTPATAGMPEGYAVSEHGDLEFSKDGARLFLGTAPKPEPPPGDDAPVPIDVDLWHYKDPLLQTMQDVRADDERERTYRGVVLVGSKRFVQLALPDMPDVEAGDDPAVVLGSSNVPYQQLISWDSSYDDVFVVNVETGKRTQVLERSYYGASLSPGGKYVVYFDGATHDWWSYRISDGARANLTDKVDSAVIWEDETHDSPSEPRPYGIAGWTAGDKAVLVYDRYDIWALDPDGGAPRNATAGAGRAGKIVFRYRSLDPDARVVPSTPVILTATNDVTKAEGFYRATLASASTPARLLMIDKAVGTPVKADKADIVVFTESRFDEFPDLWVSDLSFGSPRKVSDANPQMAQYLWGRSELIEYTNNDGKRLRAILTKPENFDPSKKYPLLVYIYEQLTQDLHTFIAPTPSHRLSLSRYASNGYVILRPDIVYETGYPGEAAEKCVLPAVQQVVDMGFIDPKRIGIQGHSWGGYQIAHLITRTDMFAAAEGGALVANMTSAYGGIRWQTGMSRAFQYEKTQSRIGAPPWDAPLQYIENSPIFWVEKVTTPFLTVHNDEDGAVPFEQGIEFFNALRRLGKEVYMFNYRGEGHHVLKRPNQKHFTVHMDEFFDHYLKGAPRPEWMEKGVPFLERGTRDVAPLFDKKKTVPTDAQGAR